MKYLFSVLIACCLSASAWALEGFDYDWNIQPGEGSTIHFVAKKSAPPPLSTKGEPAARMSVMSEPHFESQSLGALVRAQVVQIKMRADLAPYPEKDNAPKDGIAIYTENHLNIPVAFIKYRVLGEKGAPVAMPRTVRHAIFIREGRVYYVHLFVLDTEEQETMRADQIKIIEQILQMDLTPPTK